MWAKFMQVRNGYTAKIWLEFFRAEGVNMSIVPPLGAGTPMNEPRELWVPDSKTHVAAELLRKI